MNENINIEFDYLIQELAKNWGFKKVKYFDENIVREQYLEYNKNQLLIDEIIHEKTDILRNMKEMTKHIKEKIEYPSGPYIYELEVLVSRLKELDKQLEVSKNKKNGFRELKEGCLTMEVFPVDKYFKDGERDSKWDRIYSEDCNFELDRGGLTYFGPKGFYRFSLSTKNFDELYGSFSVGYHGTAGDNIPSIIKHGLIRPDSVLANELRVKKQKGGFSNFIYISRSIEYCSHYLYTCYNKGNYFPIKLPNGKFAIVVFQIRFDKQKVVKTQGNTLVENLWPKNKLIDPNFPKNETLEYLIEDESSVKCYGLMIKIIDKDPIEYWKDKAKQSDTF